MKKLTRATMQKRKLAEQEQLATLAAIVFPACTARTLLPRKGDKLGFGRDVSREEEAVRVAECANEPEWWPQKRTLVRLTWDNYGKR